jgi:GT2 family glycosyltransferase
LRALLAGHHSWYVPGARGYHMGSATTRPTANRGYYELQHRNTIALVIKDVPLRFIVRNAHRIVAHHAVALAYSARAGLLIPHLRGLARAAPAAPRWWRDRRRIQGARRISAKQFESLVSAGRRR